MSQSQPQGLLQFVGVSKRMNAPGQEPLEVLSDVTFQLDAGEVAAVVGPSGAGKTTLLCLTAGLARATTGRIVFDKRELGGMDEAQLSRLRRSEIALVFQNNLSLSALPVWENAALHLLMAGTHRRQARREAESMLDHVGLAGYAAVSTHALSGGQRRRLGLARAMLAKPRLLLADEPTADLDDATADRIEKAMMEFLESTGAAALIVTHHARLGGRAARELRLEHGRLVESP